MILDLSNFAAWVPVILETPMISHVINVIKEKEIDALAMPWVNAQEAYLLTVQWATATIEDDKAVAGEPDPSEYDEIVTTKDTKTIDAFLSHVIHARTRTAHTGEGINVMTQAEDGSLPQGLMVQNAYMELHSGSKNVTMVVRTSEEIVRNISPDPEEEDPSGKGCHSHMGTRAPSADQFDGGIRRGPWSSNAQADCDTKVREIV